MEGCWHGAGWGGLPHQRERVLRLQREQRRGGGGEGGWGFRFGEKRQTRREERVRLKGQRSPGQAKRVAQRSREEADPWLEPRVGRVEAETEVPERGKARPGVHGASPPQLAGGATDEDVVARWVDHPVVALPRVVVVPRHLSIGIIISLVNFGFLQVSTPLLLQTWQTEENVMDIQSNTGYSGKIPTLMKHLLRLRL